MVPQANFLLLNAQGTSNATWDQQQILLCPCDDPRQGLNARAGGTGDVAIQIDPRFDFDSEVEGLSAHVRKIKQASDIVVLACTFSCLYFTTFNDVAGGLLARTYVYFGSMGEMAIPKKD